MNSRIFQLSALLATFAFVATTSACPKDSKCNKKIGVTTLASVKVTEDGRSEVKDVTTTKTSKAGCTKPCCKKKNAAKVAAATVTTKGTPCTGKCASCPDCKKNPQDCATCPKCKSGSAKVAVIGTSTSNSNKPCGAGCTKPCCKTKGATVAAKGKTPCGKKCGTKKSVAVVSADGIKRCPLTGKPIKEQDCPIGKKVNAVLASLPTMKYKIGDEVTCCSKSAAAMAKKSDTKMKYLVGDDVFETAKDASAKLVALYETEVNSLNSLQFAVGSDCFRCPVTAKGKAKDSGKKITYRVAGFDFAEKSKAEDTLKKIAVTIANVKMSYKVGDQKFCCDKMAGARVKETGSTMSYIVGDDETTNEFVAKMKLAEAKIRAIIQTAFSATGS